MHALFHIKTVIIPRDRYRPEGFSPRAKSILLTGNITRAVLVKLCWRFGSRTLNRYRSLISISLVSVWEVNFVLFNSIELKRTKLTFHRDTKLIQAHERLDIALSEFCLDICPWADIVVALPVLNVWAQLTLWLMNMSISLVSVWEVNFVLFKSMLKYGIKILMHALFHIKTVIVHRPTSTLGLKPSGRLWSEFNHITILSDSNHITMWSEFNHVIILSDSNHTTMWSEFMIKL
jgi:hypothetical protein